MIDIGSLYFENLEKAVETLDIALSKIDLNDLERDGLIQRYEYTFELAWKMMRKVLIALGRTDVSSSPKPVMRDAMEEGLIENVEEWFAFLEARNLSTHIYDQDEAFKVLQASKRFLPKVKELLAKFKRLK